MDKKILTLALSAVLYLPLAPSVGLGQDDSFRRGFMNFTTHMAACRWQEGEGCFAGDAVEWRCGQGAGCRGLSKRSGWEPQGGGCWHRRLGHDCDPGETFVGGVRPKHAAEDPFSSSENLKSCDIRDLDVPLHLPSPTQTNFGTHAGYNHRWIIPRGGCIAVKFTTGKAGGYSFATEEDPIAPLSTNFLNISRYPGDFDYRNLDEKNSCAGAGGMAILRFSVRGTPEVPGTNKPCYLAGGQVYYINIRNEEPGLGAGSIRGQDSCEFTMAARNSTSTGGCGGVYQLHAWYEIPQAPTSPTASLYVRGETQEKLDAALAVSLAEQEEARRRAARYMELLKGWPYRCPIIADDPGLGRESTCTGQESMEASSCEVSFSNGTGRSITCDHFDPRTGFMVRATNGSDLDRGYIQIPQSELDKFDVRHCSKSGQWDLLCP